MQTQYKYKVIGFNKELYDSHEYVVDPKTAKIMFHATGCSITKNIKRERILLYMHDMVRNVYLELSFEEHPIASKKYSCVLGEMRMKEVHEEKAYECEYVIKQRIFIDENVRAPEYDEDIEIVCNEDENADSVWLYKISNDGGYEELPEGYAQVNESLFIQRKDVYKMHSVRAAA